MPLNLRTAIVAAVGFVVAFAVFLIASVRLARTNVLVEHGTLVKLAIVQMRFDGSQTADSVKGYALTGRPDRLEQYRNSRELLRENLDRVRELTSDNPVQQAAIEGLDARIERRLSDFQAVVDTRDSRGKDAALTLVEEQIAAQTPENRNAVVGMLAEEDRLDVERRSTANRWGIVSIVAISLASVCFALVLVSGWNVRRVDDQARLMAEATRDKLEAENAALNERAKIAEFQERFIGVLGHDLRNPLGALSMGIDLLRREVPSEQRTLERMASSARRMARMIDQLLDLTRTRLGGGIQLTCNQTDLGKLTKEIVEELKTQRQDAVVKIKTEGDLKGEWDSDRLAQVISNLVGNALHHGSLEKPVQIDLEGGDQNVSFCVHNGGAPITETLQKVLFDPFRRGERQSNSQKTAGVGLGLFISREIIEKHGGRIDVTSSSEDGTMFTFTLPRVRSSAALETGRS